MYRHWIKKFFIRFYTSIYRGFIEYCQKGCITGGQYLVKPNYHSCERCLWYVIFAVGSLIGFNIIAYYMNNFSQNVFRVVDEPRSPYLPFQYPTLGICEIGVENDKEMSIKVEQALNGSLYKQFPGLSKDGDFQDIVQMLIFPNLYRKGKLEEFLYYSKTLAPALQEYLERYDYRELANNITRNCEELFIKCSWLENSFDCCSVFGPVSTMLGKCFIFNHLQTQTQMTDEMIKQMEIFKEPYRMRLTFSKAVGVFILNSRDIPQNIIPFNNYKIEEKGTTLVLGFNIVPILNDHTLLDLDRHTLGCIKFDATVLDNNKMYASESFTTCATEHFYKEQMNLCECIDLNGPEAGGPFCNLSQFMCLEENGFNNPRSLVSLAQTCLVICDDCWHTVDDFYYRKNTITDLQDVFSLKFTLLNFPIIQRRRQAIRQAENILVAFGNILGLFMGFNVINIIEFIYLICYAFWRYDRNRTDTREVVATSVEHTNTNSTNF